MSRPRGSLVIEFVIVTMGVALALAADSALGRYREKAAAQSALVAVRRDVAADIDELGGRLRRSEDGVEARQRLKAVAMNRAEIRDSVLFVDDLRLLLDYLTFDANTTAVEALRSSGRLDLIASAELREALLEYLNQVENVAEADVARRQAILGYSERLLPHLVEGPDWTGLDWTRLERPEVERRAWAAEALNSAVIRESGALRELLLLTESPLGWQRFFYGDLLEDAEALARLLDEAIGA